MKPTIFNLGSALLAAHLALIPSTVSAQNEAHRIAASTYKVGDRISANPIHVASAWDACTIIGVRLMPSDASKVDAYQIRCDNQFFTSVIAVTDDVRSLGQANVLSSGAAAAAQPPAGSNVYGTRNPRPCGNISAATITSALATQYFICQRENIHRDTIELVDNVQVQVAGPTRYDPYTQTGFSQMDTRVPPYAIRGSFVDSTCTTVDAKFDSRFNNFGKNCSRYTHRNATGYCYKKRTGEWNCTMNDYNIAETDKQHNVAPPK